MTFGLRSPAFTSGGEIPTRHTPDGENMAPRLTWFGAPDGTRSFVLVMDDPDAPGTTLTHWVVFDIPADATGLVERAEAEVGVPGLNSFGHRGYGGPCPPPGSRPHRYRLALYALDTPSLGLGGGAPRGRVEEAMRGHVLAQAQLVARYQRQPDAVTH